MKEFKIYLAGGCQNLSWEEQNTWRELAKDWLERRECDYYVKVINPCDYYNFKEKRHLTEKEIMNFDLNHVRSSDLIFVNFNDPNSIGTTIELFAAYDNHIPIIGLLEDQSASVHPWLLECVDRMCNDFKGALDYIEEFYLN